MIEIGPYSEMEILNMRERVRHQLILILRAGDGKKFNISERELEDAFYLYDRVFLKGYMGRRVANRISFSISTRMTRAAGKTIFIRSRNTYEIRIGIRLLQGYGEIKGQRKVCGIRTKDVLEAFQLILEHEICHVLEYSIFGKSSCKQKKFKGMANGIFGHVDSVHHLFNDVGKAEKCFSFYPGQRVRFHYQGCDYKGVIHRIQKRATVMVLDPMGIYQDTEGNRYTKFYVPLSKLYIL